MSKSTPGNIVCIDFKHHIVNGQCGSFDKGSITVEFNTIQLAVSPDKPLIRMSVYSTESSTAAGGTIFTCSIERKITIDVEIGKIGHFQRTGNTTGIANRHVAPHIHHDRTVYCHGGMNIGLVSIDDNITAKDN